jgi:hypothetical protein
MAKNVLLQNSVLSLISYQYYKRGWVTTNKKKREKAVSHLQLKGALSRCISLKYIDFALFRKYC